MQQELLVVELLLHASHHGVGDRAVVAYAEQLLPLHGEQLACEAQVRDGFGLDRVLERAVRVAAQMTRAETIPIARVRQRAGVHPRLRRELLEPGQCRLRGAEPGGDLFALLLLTRFAHAQPPHQRREREPLAEQRDENDAVRESDDGVAAGEWYAGGRHGGDRGGENEGVTAS